MFSDKFKQIEFYFNVFKFYTFNSVRSHLTSLFIKKMYFIFIMNGCYNYKEIYYIYIYVCVDCSFITNLFQAFNKLRELKISSLRFDISAISRGVLTKREKREYRRVQASLARKYFYESLSFPNRPPNYRDTSSYTASFFAH